MTLARHAKRRDANEPAIVAAQAQRFQFERQGYFCKDLAHTPARPVFNRTVALRDSFGG